MLGKPTAKYEIIKTAATRNDNLLNIGWLCDIAGASRFGYYCWFSTEKSKIDRERQDERDFNLISVTFKYRGYDKGICHRSDRHSSILIFEEMLNSSHFSCV